MQLATHHQGDRLVAAFAVDDRLVSAEAAASAAGLPIPTGFASVRGILRSERDAVARAHEAAHELAAADPDGAAIATASARLAPPVPDPEKIVCLGLNYRDHAAETEQAAPPAPMLFAKYRNSLAAHEEEIQLPPVWASEVDWEGEIAVVIGRTLRDADEEGALAAAAGWMPFNDVSARDLQLLTPQWTAGKAVDGFGPCGPFLTIDESLADGRLELTTRLNGEVVQNATATEMVFSVSQTLSFLSSFMTLVPGDIVVTGTPAGVGMSRQPQRFLRHGDVVEVEVGDQTLRNAFVARNGGNGTGGRR